MRSLHGTAQMRRCGSPSGTHQDPWTDHQYAFFTRNSSDEALRVSFWDTSRSMDRPSTFFLLAFFPFQILLPPLLAVVFLVLLFLSSFVLLSLFYVLNVLFQNHHLQHCSPLKTSLWKFQPVYQIQQAILVSSFFLFLFFVPMTKHHPYLSP